MLNAVAFDLDNTLVDRDAAVLAWLRDTVPAETVAPLAALDTGGYGDRRRWMTAVSCACQRDVDALVADFRANMPSHLRLMPGAEALLDRLAGRCRLAIASNGSGPMQRAKLAAVGLDRRFATILISDEVGARKPDATFFNALLSVLGGPAEACLMVGDHPINDIAGARAVGMRTCWLRNRHFTNAVGADHAVDDLQEVPAP